MLSPIFRFAVGMDRAGAATHFGHGELGVNEEKMQHSLKMLSLISSMSPMVSFNCLL